MILDFEQCTVVYRNLGGKDNADDPPEIYYQGVGRILSTGESVNLRITTESDYKCINCRYVRNGPFGQIMLKGESSYSLLLEYIAL